MRLAEGKHALLLTGHLLCAMVRAKTKVAALQPTVCAAWLQAWMSILYSVK